MIFPFKSKHVWSYLAVAMMWNMTKCQTAVIVGIVEVGIKDIIFTRGLTVIVDIKITVENMDVTEVGKLNYFNIASKFLPSVCYYGNIGCYA